MWSVKFLFSYCCCHFLMSCGLYVEVLVNCRGSCGLERFYTNYVSLMISMLVKD